jgi:competence protein ComEA
MLMSVEVEKPPPGPAGGATTPAGEPGRSLVGWATVLALALTALAALGFVWLRDRRAAARPRPFDGLRASSGEPVEPLPAGDLRLRLDINAASAGELDLLPGVGAFRASKIVEARKARGGFKRLAELDEPGLLGPGAAARLAPYLQPLPGDRP